MIDLRHHIYSLVAVFLALAVGMVIGSSFEATSPIERQQNKIAHLNRILERLEADFVTLRSEVVEQQGQIKEFESEIKRSDEYCRALVPSVIKGKLQWKNVAIIQTGDYGEDTTAIKAVLEQAGARITSITHINGRNSLTDPDKSAEIATSCEMDTRVEPCRSILKYVAKGVTASQQYDKLLKLQDKEILSLSGDYSYRNSCIIVLGGAKATDTSDEIDSILIEELRTQGATVVGCEPFAAGVSFIHTYKEAGIASVDNVDKPFGQIGLVCALAGEVASFGIKPTADRLMPQTLSGSN